VKHHFENNWLCTAQQKVNEVIAKAEEAESSLNGPGWSFWLATASFPNGSPNDFTTKVPVASIPSAYFGEYLADLSKTLTEGRKEVESNRNFFAALDERTKTDGFGLLCHVEKDDSVDSLRVWPKNASLYLSGMAMSSDSWDELKYSSNIDKRNRDDVID